ncbi:MAG: RNA polymerase sigma factor [Pseudonocardiaceae bacterium]
MDERELPAGSPVAPDQGSAPLADAAFSAFYRRFVPTLVGFLVWQGARLPDAADLAQVTMSAAYRYWSTIREPEAWARRVASRELARHIARVEPEDPASEIPEHSSLLPPLTNVTAWKQQHEVLRLLDLRPPRQRQVMAWRLEGYTPAEIAAELKITSESVRSNLWKARKTLAQHLGVTGEER